MGRHKKPEPPSFKVIPPENLDYLPPPKCFGGQKHKTEEERKEALKASNRRSYYRRRDKCLVYKREYSKRMTKARKLLKDFENGNVLVSTQSGFYKNVDGELFLTILQK